MRSPVPLAAKVARPRVSGIVARPRLFRLLDQRRPLLWLSAPPGAGKTTLVASYVAARKVPALWYQLDAGDGDVAGFFYHLGLAVRRAAPRARRPLPLLRPENWLALGTFARG